MQRFVDFVSFFYGPPVHANFTLGMFVFLLLICKYSLYIKALDVLSAIYGANTHLS